MKTSLKGLNLIKGTEALRLEAYQDTGGVWTIGYGHTRGVTPGMVLSGEDEALKLLADDVRIAEESVRDLVKVPLTQGMFDALVSFEFNTGRLGSSTLLRVLNSKNYFDVPGQFVRWYYDDGKPQRGLLIRRIEEARLFASEPFPK